MAGSAKSVDFEVRGIPCRSRIRCKRNLQPRSRGKAAPRPSAHPRLQRLAISLRRLCRVAGSVWPHAPDPLHTYTLSLPLPLANPPEMHQNGLQACLCDEPVPVHHPAQDAVRPGGIGPRVPDLGKGAQGQALRAIRRPGQTVPIAGADEGALHSQVRPCSARHPPLLAHAANPALAARRDQGTVGGARRATTLRG